MNQPYTQRPVGVIVVTHNSEAVLGDLLDSLDSGMEDLEWQLQLVDNGSCDRTVADARRRRPGVRVIEMGGNFGFAVAVNRGLRRVDGRSDVLLLNPDVRLEAGAGRNLQRRLGSNVGIAAPRALGADGALLPTLRHEPTPARSLAEALFGARRAGARGWGESILDPAAYERPTVADWASGAALMISRECLDACGPLDESFFLYSEDTEYALRARDRGFLTALAPEAAVTHLGGASRTDPRLWSMLVANKQRLYARRHGRLRGLGFRAASLLRELRFAATGNRPSRAAARALLSGPGGER